MFPVCTSLMFKSAINSGRTPEGINSERIPTKVTDDIKIIINHGKTSLVFLAENCLLIIPLIKISRNRRRYQLNPFRQLKRYSYLIFIYLLIFLIYIILLNNLNIFCHFFMLFVWYVLS